MDDEAIRLSLHTLLIAAFPTLGIYYMPPGNMELERPCIVYEPKALEPSHANNQPYVVGTRFQATILSDLPGYSDKRAMLELSGVVVTDNRSYVSKDVVHNVFTISVNTIT